MTADTKADVYQVARLVLSRIAHPVAIIGAAHEGERSCATGTTMYVSLAPAMVAIAEHHDSRTTRLVQESRQFSVSLLRDSQQDLAAAAGKPAAGPDKFAALRIPVAEPPEGLTAPAVAGSMAAHQIDERRVDPLLRYRRRYMRSGHWTSEESPEGYPT